jgi:alcohol dehydrogenase
MSNLLRFKMPGEVIMAPGSRKLLPEILQRLSKGKVLIVTDRGLLDCGVCQQVVDVLDEAELQYDVFDGVEPDPRIEIVQACAKAAEGFAVVLGLGGGSSMDIAKLAAIVAKHGGDIRDSIGVDQTPGRGMPTIMMPTTAGTGSEVTPIAVLSDKQANLKKGIVSDDLYADVALVDPELMVGLPPFVTAFTGMDTLTHAVEAYTNRHSIPFVDGFALEAIRLIGRSLRRCVCVGEDINAREDMALASLYGGMCLGSVNTAAVHALAYPLGGMFDVAHGVANSLLLPHVMEFNLVSDLDKFTDIAKMLGEEVDGLSLRDSAEMAVEAVKQLSEDVGIVTRMRDLDIPKDAIDEMADGAMKVTRLLGNNPRVVKKQDAREIYQNAY